jgi:hypothetical protein
MAFPQAHPQRRAPRAQLGDLIAASVQRENGQWTKGKLRTVSTTGGLLQLSNALVQGDFVEVAFQTRAGKVQGLAEMLSPVQQPQDGVLQAFRYVALGDDDHLVLRMTIDSAAERNSLKFNSISRA